jgi:two-component system, sensor histidine kinase
MSEKQISKTAKLSLSERILISILFVSASISLIYVPLFIFVLKTNIFSILLAITSSFLFCLLYYLTKYQRLFYYTSIIFISTILIVLSFGWFVLGGIDGGIGYYYVVAISFFIIISPLKYRNTLLSLTICLIFGLYFFEINYGQEYIYALPQEYHSLTLLTNIILSICLISWAVTSTKIEYEEEHNKTKEQNKALINAHATKSRFLAKVSHELRTPMNGIMGMASILEETTLTDEQKECISAIMVSSNRLLKIINQILDFTKSENNNSKLYNQPFFLNQCIKDVIQINALNAQKKQLTLTYEIDDNINDNLIGDSEKLEHILLNLIDNAIKFTSKGSIHLRIQKQPTDSKRLKLLFSIKDTGIGIEKKLTKNIFDAFTQVDDSRTREYSGTGLGLAISKRIVELMGGNIWLKSEQGKGSNFFFTIKLDVFHNKSIIPDSVSNKIINPLTIIKSPLKILIVEDDKINQLLAIRLLEKMGYNPDAVDNGQKALNILTKRSYNFVFMDIQMPIMDGLTTTEIIRKKHQHQPIIIAMTANAMPEDRLLCEVAGMDDFLPKPIKLKTLEKMLQMWQLKI